MGEDLECLCQIMRTVGPRLDHAKAKVSVIRIESGLYSYWNPISVQGWRVYVIAGVVYVGVMCLVFFTARGMQFVGFFLKENYAC